MKNDKFTPLLERYVDKELNPEERARVDAHLPTCPDCRRIVNELRELQVMLRTSPLVEQPESHSAKMADRFWETWNLRKRARRVAPSRPMPFFSSARLVALAAAAVLLVAVGVVSLRSVHTILPYFGVQQLQPLHQPPDTTHAPPAPLAGANRTGERPGSAEQGEGAAQPSPKPPGTLNPAATTTKAGVTMVRKPSATGGLPGTSGPATGSSRAAANRTAPATVSKATALPPSAPPLKSDYGGGTSTGQGKASPAKKTVKVAGDAVKRTKATPDTTIYADNQLDTKPAMLAQPDFPDSISSKLAGLQLPLWVVIEKNGAVSHAELRTTMDIGGLEPAVLRAVRQTPFSPGKIGDQPVRTGMLILVTIRGKSGKND